MIRLSNTRSILLSRASQHEALLAAAPETLPAAARNAVSRSMLTSGLLEELPASKLAPWGKAPRVPAG